MNFKNLTTQIITTVVTMTAIAAISARFSQFAVLTKGEYWAKGADLQAEIRKNILGGILS